MEMHSQTIIIPQEFEAIKPYDFSKLYIHKDFAIGVSNAAKIIFEFPNNEGNYGPLIGGLEFSILAIPTLDGNEINSLDRFMEVAQKVKCQDVEIMDDFNIPWIALQEIPFPKVPKKKVKKPDQLGQPEGSDESDEEEEDEEQQDEEDEASGEQEEASESSDQEGSDGSDGSDKGSDDDDDDQGSNSSKKKKSGSKISNAYRLKNNRLTQARKMRKKGQGSESSDSIEYEDMTDEQKRQYDVNQFVKGLNQRKPHFENINRVMPGYPIVEATEVDEDMTSRVDTK